MKKAGKPVGPPQPMKGFALLQQKPETPKMFKALTGGKGQSGIALLIQLKRERDAQVLLIFIFWTQLSFKLQSSRVTYKNKLNFCSKIAEGSLGCRRNEKGVGHIEEGAKSKAKATVGELALYGRKRDSKCL